MKILIEIMFDGTRYHGWQVQPNGNTVQNEVQRAIEDILGKRYPLTGCSRTDSGVHAKQFFAVIDTGEDIIEYVDILSRALSSKLPPDISVVSAKVVPDDFHPRYSCRMKEYEYLISDSDYSDPFYVNRVLQTCRHLDEIEMARAAEYIKGEHDFTSFCSAGADNRDSNVRTVYDIDVTRNGDMIKITVSANGFLYNMVRIIAGTLIRVGLGKMRADEVKDVIDHKNRSEAGPTAPAYGLYLNRVVY